MDDLDTTFTVLRFMGPALAGLTAILVGLMLWAPLVLYILARWRQNREPNPDPQLGLKFALHYFAMMAAQIGIFGLAIFLYSIVSNLPSAANGELRRVAAGMILPALVVLTGYLVLRPRTNDDHHGAVHRMYNGFQLMITGAVAFLLLVGGSQVLFQKGDTNGVGRAVLTFLVVYGGAAAWYATRAARLSGVVGSGGSWGSGDEELLRPIVTPPAAVAGQGGLPPLGGGAYPPLDPP